MENAQIDSTISFGEIAGIAYRYRRAVVIAFFAPIVLAILLVLLLPPVYRAEVELVVKTGREFIAQGVGENTPTAPQSTKQEDINSEIELLNSRAMAVDTITKVGLNNLFPGIVENPPWMGTVMDAAVKSFDSHLDVEPVKLSNMIDVTYEASSRAEAERVLDQFITAYQQRHADVFAAGRKESAETTLKQYLAEMDDLEKQRTKIKLANNIYDISQQRAALITQQVEAQSKLQESIGEQASLEQQIAYLKQERSKVPSVLPAAEMEHATEAMTDLQQSESEMASRFGPGNPDLIRVREQLRDLRQKMGGMKGEVSQSSMTPSPIAQQIDVQLVTDQAELAPLQDEIKRGQALVSSLGDELHRLEQADLDLRSVETRLDAMADNLKIVQANYDQAMAEEELDRSRVVSVVPVYKATAPDKPAQPKPVLYTAGGILAGILFAGGMIMFRVVTYNRLIDERGAERLLGLPILAAVPYMPVGLLPRPDMKALPG